MKLSCIYSKSHKSYNLFHTLNEKYKFYPAEEADAIICLGGDGFILYCMHRFLPLDKPLYGINCGNLGFLMNKLNLSQDLEDLVAKAVPLNINPLETNFENIQGYINSGIAFNEISFLRCESLAAHLRVKIDNKIRVDKLVADGILVCTPTGSSAYNLACGGNVIQAASKLLVLTPISPFSPLGWKGTTLGDQHVFEIINLDPKKRKINMFCDFKEFRLIVRAEIKLCTSKKITLLFNQEENLENKLLKSQFSQY
ncbi:putative inorganic polyphosphate/ATP-NAD kinase [Candidatus Hepatincolaceae symbiont of Richtersius coronifer]